MNGAQAIEQAIRRGREDLQRLILASLDEARTGAAARRAIRAEQERGRTKTPEPASPAANSGIPKGAG